MQDEELLDKLINDKFNYQQCLLNYLIYKASLNNQPIFMHDNAHALFSTYDNSFKDFLRQTFPNLEITSQYEPEVSDIGPEEKARKLFEPRTPLAPSMYKQPKPKPRTLLEQFYKRIQQFGSQARTIFKQWWNKKQAH